MLSNDGLYVIYRIQHREKRPQEWMFSNFEAFGCPPGFSVSDKCWQETGVFGVYDRMRAKRGLVWIKSKNPEFKFRLVCMVISQKTLEV